MLTAKDDEYVHLDSESVFDAEVSEIHRRLPWSIRRRINHHLFFRCIWFEFQNTVVD